MTSMIAKRQGLPMLLAAALALPAWAQTTPAKPAAAEKAATPAKPAAKKDGEATYEMPTKSTGGKTREQDPIYAAQGHAIYNFPRGKWASFDVTYFTGGQTTIDGAEKADLQKNWRLGGTYAFPLNAQNSIKLYASSGVADRTGNSYDLLGIAWQHRWIAGRRAHG